MCSILVLCYFLLKPKLERQPVQRAYIPHPMVALATGQINTNKSRLAARSHQSKDSMAQRAICFALFFQSPRDLNPIYR